MQPIISCFEPPSDRASSLRSALATAPLARYCRGLLATGLVEDVQKDGAFTLLAPTNEAFDGMPWSFDELLFDERLLEARFDLFEYLVVRGKFAADGPRGSQNTLHGQAVRLGHGLAFGRFGAARVLQTLETGFVVVHVLEQCIFPWDPKLCLAERTRA